MCSQVTSKDHHCNSRMRWSLSLSVGLCRAKACRMMCGCHGDMHYVTHVAATYVAEAPLTYVLNPTRPWRHSSSSSSGISNTHLMTMSVRTCAV
jgi:hypothetical protein